MADRLAQIWKGFERRTSLNLSGTSIENTPRPEIPEREDAELRMELGDRPLAIQPTTDGVDAVNAALSAMHTEMAARAKSRRPHTEEELRALRSLPEADIERTLFADASFTRSKTERGASDYITYAADRQLDWQKRKKKWFFGLF